MRLIGLFQMVGGAFVSSDVMKLRSVAALFEMWMVFSLCHVLLRRLRMDSLRPFGWEQRERLMYEDSDSWRLILK